VTEQELRGRDSEQWKDDKDDRMTEVARLKGTVVTQSCRDTSSRAILQTHIHTQSSACHDNQYMSRGLLGKEKWSQRRSQRCLSTNWDVGSMREVVRLGKVALLCVYTLWLSGRGGGGGRV
jgi:hypothetical protein